MPEVHEVLAGSFSIHPLLLIPATKLSSMFVPPLSLSLSLPGSASASPGALPEPHERASAGWRRMEKKTNQREIVFSEITSMWGKICVFVHCYMLLQRKLHRDQNKSVARNEFWYVRHDKHEKLDRTTWYTLNITCANKVYENVHLVRWLMCSGYLQVFLRRFMIRVAGSRPILLGCPPANQFIGRPVYEGRTDWRTEYRGVCRYTKILGGTSLKPCKPWPFRIALPFPSTWMEPTDGPTSTCW